MKLFVLIFCLVLVFFSISSFQKNSSHHPFEGEVLSFERTTFDCGMKYFSDRERVAFPFVNKSGHDVIIKEIVSNNDYNSTPFDVGRIIVGKVIKAGQRDTIFFGKRMIYDWFEGLYDNSWTVSFEGTEIKQHLNIFCELKSNQGKLVADTIHLPIIKRGEIISFEATIRNIGTEPVSITKSNFPKGISMKNELTLPLTIKPNEFLMLNFDLNTSDHYKEYKSVISFTTNEDVAAYKTPTVQIPYYGELIFENTPSIKFDSTTLTLNTYEHGPGQFHFWFTNDGDAPLVISMVKTSCGCLVATYPKEPIAPGERAEIKVQYATSRLGPLNKSITVYTNVSTTPLVLRVKGYVTPKVNPEINKE